MSFTNNALKLLNNKYMFYFVVFLSVTNILGYLATNKMKGIVIFILTGLLMSHFTKNYTSILLVCLVITNFLMSFKQMREGMESTTSEDDSKLEDIDPKLKQGIDKLKQSNKSLDEIKTELKTNTQTKMDTINAPSDPNNLDAPVPEEEGFTPEGAGSSNNKKQASKASNGRIDYASTLEEAYDNLDQMLGSDGITKLTNDTQTLMTQQKKLFDTMKTMSPMLKEAKEMLGGFDLKSLGNLTGAAVKI